MRPLSPDDASLVDAGNEQIAWAEAHMPTLVALRSRLRSECPFKGHRIVGCTHLTKETAVLIRTLHAGGADLAWCASNPVTTQEAVAAALRAEGTPIFGHGSMTSADYYGAIDRVILALTPSPTLAVDDGGDLIVALHTSQADAGAQVAGGTDKTTTGVERARALHAAGALKFPILAVNDAFVKCEFDNVYGTGQSAIDGILRATGMLLAGKTFVVAGFGHVGRGVATCARGLGARVVVTEVRPTTALQAALEGFEVMSMDGAAGIGDVFCTATGVTDAITARHIARMRSGVVLCNIGHFDCEINLTDLASAATTRRFVRPHVEEYVCPDGRRIWLLGKGRVINLTAAEGNPAEIMDLTFTAQVFALTELTRSAGSLDIGVHRLSAGLDEAVARLKLETMGVSTDHLSSDQTRYAVDFGVRSVAAGTGDKATSR